MNTFENYLLHADFAANFRAHSECVDFENSNGKRFVLLYADLRDSLKQICKNGPYIEKEFNGDWSYEEEKFRKAFGHAFNSPKLNSVATNLASQTSNTIKSLELYAGYLLKTKPTDSTREVKLIRPKSLSALFSMEAKFLDWLKTKDLSERSIQSYVGAISGTLSKLLEINLFCITDCAEFEHRVKELETNDDYLRLENNGKSMYSAAIKHYRSFLEDRTKAANGGHQVEHALDYSVLPKPFLLLAGISGTGKTRFVREQAKAAAIPYGMTKGENHCLVPVRPDWHEPSDLLGYISRIGSGGARFVTTDLLRFIVAAWKHAAHEASASKITHRALNTICPYWLCLDEMNLAPVEQYFADYLSILETRRWKDGVYACEPLLKPAVIQQQLDEEGREDLWVNLGLSDVDDSLSSGLRDYFLENGIPLPPNLIVAGTVNMDETTHGFSRKVIDRALTLDFGEFFPNDYQHYFENDKATAVKLLGFPHISEISKKDDLAGVAADSEGGETIAFLTAVNGVLAGTPFELAYRALNEALLAVVCFNPADESELQAVWDDFLMMKVLPRIEGDAEKLGSQDEKSLLTRLSDLLKEKFTEIIAGRRDLLNQSLADGGPVPTKCRSLKKLAWMQKRLADNGFTSYWP
jgi:hypothetical protein